MNHVRAQELLASRHELTVRDEAALSLHLTDCHTCSEIADAYREQSFAIANLRPASAPMGLRQSVLAKAGTKSIREPRWWFRFMPMGLAAAAVLLLATLLGSQVWSPFSSGGHLLSEAAAVRTALAHSVIGSDRRLPPQVKVAAHLGGYPGVNTAWLVTISGPGVSVISPLALTGQIHANKLPLLHRETVVVDGRTGAFIETFTANG